LHELAIAEGIVRVASEHAGTRRVAAVEVKVGRLRQVVPSALAFSFELVARGTPVEDAELLITDVAARGLCRACGHHSELPAFPLRCERCGGLDLEITAGEELHVEALELEEQPVGCGG
jgi:hydrogenase nickel incorporation protein HypA/HybF